MQMIQMDYNNIFLLPVVMITWHVICLSGKVNSLIIAAPQKLQNPVAAI